MDEADSVLTKHLKQVKSSDFLTTTINGHRLIIGPFYTSYADLALTNYPLVFMRLVYFSTYY